MIPPLQQVRAKVIEVNPSILDLVFGCEVMVKTEAMGKIKTVVRGFESHHPDNPTKAGRVLTTHFGGVEDENIEEVLGRKITLSDILVAIEKTNDTDPRRDEYFVGTDGWWYALGKKDGEIIALPQNVQWDLTKDLSGQSEDVVAFLYELLT